MGYGLRRSQVWVVMNDIQIPFHDRRVLNRLVLPFVEDLKPDGIILNGDVVDCYSISDFDKDPLTTATLGREVTLAQGLMARLRAANPRAELIWLGGNHEDRLRRHVWKHPELLERLDRASKKRVVATLDFPEVFSVVSYGFRWKPYGDTQMLGKLMVTHGSMVNKHSGQTARSHFERYGNSVLVGHTHRGGAFYKRNVRGVHVAYENFCLCRLDPEYVTHPDWQQGFSVVHVAFNGFFSVQQIPILPGNRLYYGGQLVEEQ